MIPTFTLVPNIRWLRFLLRCLRRAMSTFCFSVLAGNGTIKVVWGCCFFPLCFRGVGVAMETCYMDELSNRKGRVEKTF